MASANRRQWRASRAAAGLDRDAVVAVQQCRRLGQDQGSATIAAAGR
jgi:hypothetical protein